MQGAANRVILTLVRPARGTPPPRTGREVPMLQETRDRIVALYHALEERGIAEFDRQVKDRSYCVYEGPQRGPIEELFDLVFLRHRDRAEIHLRMPPPGDEVEAVLDGEVRMLAEVDLQDAAHLACDGYHVETVGEIADEIMDKARLQLEE